MIFIKNVRCWSWARSWSWNVPELGGAGGQDGPAGLGQGVAGGAGKAGGAGLAGQKSVFFFWPAQPLARLGLCPHCLITHEKYSVLAYCSNRFASERES